MDGGTRQFLTAPQFQFPLDVLAVRGNRFDTQVKSIRNFVSGVPVANQLKYFQLAIAQMLGA